MIKIAISFFLSGLLFGSGPCIASCGPILISYIAGTKKNIFKGLMVYILFSLVKISVYAVLSLLVYFLGRFVMERLLGEFSRYTLILGGGFIIIIGALMILGKRWEFKPLALLHKDILEHDNKSVAVLGLVMGLAPCAPLLAMLSYVGLISQSWVNSLLYGFSFGLGTFASPLILLVLLTGLIPGWLKDKKAVYSEIFSFICGLLIIFLGIQLIIKVF